jgi:hypothetical protein
MVREPQTLRELKVVETIKRGKTIFAANSASER